ncbi:hypothetical protein [Actinoplanes sp. TFC3]|uniref:hypothetical protein n=1 Tax=Actinoplanes sp. TFC3 TaxID=1710355 RepID=UPI00082F4422|nr:hypothetical protein [Actinoplanes sp. TFC3]
MRPLAALVPMLLALAACTGPAPDSTGTASAAPSSSAATGELQPVFPALTGDVVTSAKLLTFDPGNRAAIVEPIVFAQAQQYCAKMHIDPVDNRCAQELIIVNSNTRVTLAMRAGVELRGMGDGTGDCLGDMDKGATCKVTSAYVRTLAQNDAAVVITLRDGTLARIAELYQP